LWKSDGQPQPDVYTVAQFSHRNFAVRRHPRRMHDAHPAT
jgi:hypothetical protein